MASETPKNPTQPEEKPPVSQIEYLRALTEIVCEEELSELEIENAGVRITLKAPETALPAGAAPLPAGIVAQPIVPSVAQPFVQAQTAGMDAPVGATPDSELIEIISPMVGVFYRAPSPSDPNFVEVGDRVEEGQTVALIEAMKVFNEIVAESAGTVIDIKAQNSDLVETGGVLMTLCPHQIDS